MNFGPKRMQGDRYLILLYAATIIDEFKQRGTKHWRLLYFSYNELNKISKSPLLCPPGPLRFESTRTARNKVYPSLRTRGWVRIERIDIESYKGAECVAITKQGTDVAKKRLKEIENGFSKQVPGIQQPLAANVYVAAAYKAEKSNDANVWLHKGFTLSELGKYIEAISCYNISLQIDPTLALAWNNKGNSLINLENYSAAILCLERALQIDPNLVLAWDNKAWVLGCLEKYDESIQCIDQALQIDPNFATAWYRKGWTLQKLGKYDEAKQYIDKARELGYEG